MSPRNDVSDDDADNSFDSDHGAKNNDDQKGNKNQFL